MPREGEGWRKRRAQRRFKKRRGGKERETRRGKREENVTKKGGWKKWGKCDVKKKGRGRGEII